MTLDRPNPDSLERNELDERPDRVPPSSEEVVERLDKLWSAMPSKQSESSVAFRVGHFEVQRILGQGTFGVVYLATDTRLDREVALKLPRPEVLVDEEKRWRFANEAMSSAALDHPFIVAVHEAEIDGATPYIAAAYCAGPDLGKWLAARDCPVSCDHAARFVAQLAEAVHYAHTQGVVHRDLKPTNILLKAVNGESDGESDGDLGHFVPQLTDFGLAKMAGRDLVDTRSSLIVGTPLYMAPEQLNGEPTDDEAAPVDIYALGCLLFEIITGRTPIEGGTYFQVADTLRDTVPPKLRTLRADVPRELDTICAKCLEKDPRDRYASAGALADDLIRCCEGRPIAGRMPGILARLRAWTGWPKRIRDAG